MTITKQHRLADFRMASKWLALLVSFVLGLICAVALANELPDSMKQEFATDLVELEHDDE